VERSDTHQRQLAKKMGFAKAQPILRAALGALDEDISIVAPLFAKITDYASPVRPTLGRRWAGDDTSVLIETWHPVTKDIGFIKGSAEMVVSAFTRWHEELGIHYTTREAYSLGESLERLPPLSMEKRRVLFLPTNSDWTAFVQSGIHGSDPVPAMSYLSRRLGILAMRVCATTDHAMWPAVMWEVYAPPALGGDPPLNYRRAISASNDGGRWGFCQSGAPYPFEELSAYSRRRTRDRFTRDMLERYLREFEITPFADEFYAVSRERPAVMLERISRWPDIPQEFTLEQARRMG
jgi:hypothetical protein